MYGVGLEQVLVWVEVQEGLQTDPGPQEDHPPHTTQSGLEEAVARSVVEQAELWLVSP